MPTQSPALFAIRGRPQNAVPIWSQSETPFREPAASRIVASSSAPESCTSARLDVVIHEVVTNVAKHTKATATNITIEAEDARLTITVADNGDGLSQDDRFEAKGLGLSNLTARAEALDGVCKLGRVSRRSAARLHRMPPGVFGRQPNSGLQVQGPRDGGRRGLTTVRPISE